MPERRGREGQSLGNYRLTRLLDKGGFAEVYLGEHVYLNTQVAIKVLHTLLTSEAMGDFLEEARHLSHLVHPHIIRVLDFGVQDGTPFLIMDYAPHGSLRQRHPKGTSVALSNVVVYVRHVADALQYAHNQKLIHRDIKPENMLLGPNREVLLSDFGIALLTPDSASLHVPEMIGTMAYMAPEQIRGKPGPASDQYALGVVVYEWLCGERPFSGSVSELFSQHLFAPPLPLHDKIPAISPALDAVVLRALAKDPQLRFEDVQTFAAALEEASSAVASSKTLFVPEADPSVAGTAAPAKEPSETEGTSPFLNTPPFHLSPLLGREQEVQAAMRLIQRTEVRLLTVTGPGGVGKTRFALEVAADLRPHFANGICFVALAPISDPELVVPAIAQALELKEGGDQSLFERTSAFLREKRLLLLLDNFEQIVALPPALSRLLASCTQVKLLITSRALLHIEGEHEFPLSPLALPDPKHLSDLENLAHSAAVALFVQRAQALKHDFELTAENASAIATICMRLDGLPLAIELAAARIKLLPPKALLARLTRRLTVLTGGRQDLPARQQTLRNTISWSYDLLTADEQQLFRRLSVFVGGCTLEAVEALYEILGDASAPVLDEVASLLDKSLLMQIEHRSEEPRLSLLETIREYGWGCLAANGEVEAVRDAHALYYSRLVEEAEPKLYGAEQELWLVRLDREQGNIREAVQWLMEQREKQAKSQATEAALRMSGAMWWYWFVRGNLSEGRKILEYALAQGKEVPLAVRVKALIAIELLAFSQNDLEYVESLAHESLELCRELADSWGMAHSLHLMGLVANVKGDYRAAQSLLEEGLALSREQGDTWSIAYALADLVKVVRTQGDYAKAHDLAQEALALFRKLEDKRGIAYGLRRLAEVLLAQGNTFDSHPLFNEALSMFKEVGDREDIARTLELLAEVHFFQGDMAMARRLAEESVSCFLEIGNLRSFVNPIILLAKVNSAQGNHLAAYAYYEKLWQMGREMKAMSLLVYCLIGFAEVAMAQEQTTWAVRLMSAAEALLATIGMLLYPVERRDFDHLTSQARSQLGEKSFAVAWEQGRSMTPEQAFAAREPQAISTESSPVLPLTTPGTPTPSYPAGLTAREVEVLRLVAQGLSNAQIAEQLVISPYTVNAHMRSIYNKLEVNSRIAVVQFATKHHLV